MRKMILTVIAALLLTAVPALADNGDKGDWELGLFGGYGWLDDYGPYRPRNDFLYGARAGYFFTPHWSAELAWQRLPTLTKFPESLGLRDENMTLDCYRLNMLYNFNEGDSFRPFLTAGVGCEHVNIRAYGDRSDVGYNAGGGLRWFLTPHFDMRLDGRVVLTPVGGDIDSTQQNIEGTFGIGWVFGAPQAATPAATTPDTDTDGDGVYDRTEPRGDGPWISGAARWTATETVCPTASTSAPTRLAA